MKVNVLFFGQARDWTGFERENFAIRDGATLDDLWRDYEGRFPRLREMNGALVAAVNQEVADRSRILRDGDEVAFLPPVSGGSEPDFGRDFYRITRDVIPTARLADELKAPGDGAVVVFEGIVRNHSAGRKTLHLEYEAYEAMAIRKMQEIGTETKRKFSIDRISMIHRVGRLAIGETSVAIIVTAAHRGAAFEACHYAIDRLKQIVPIWKKEFFEDGAVWAEGEGQKKVLMESSRP